MRVNARPPRSKICMLTQRQSMALMGFPAPLTRSSAAVSLAPVCPF
jgi:hypothetical protein